MTPVFSGCISTPHTEHFTMFSICGCDFSLWLVLDISRANEIDAGQSIQLFGMKMAFLGMKALLSEQCHQLRLRASAFLKTIEI
jgi:hypothetical protein